MFLPVYVPLWEVGGEAFQEMPYQEGRLILEDMNSWVIVVDGVVMKERNRGSLEATRVWQH